MLAGSSSAAASDGTAQSRIEVVPAAQRFLVDGFGADIEGCCFRRNEPLHPYLYGRFLGCHDERHIKHLHN
jgi:hypothetical protein